MLNRELIKKIPKTDLHVHLDGSLRIETLIELAKQQNIQLPSYTKEGLEKLVFKENYKNLVEYLQGFNYTTSVMQNPENIERISYEFAMDNAEEGVRYVEIRFAPQLHINKILNFDNVLMSVNKGLEKAKKEINNNKIDPDLPDFEYGIIVCSLRYFNANLGYYYNTIMSALEYSEKDAIFAQASLQLAIASIKTRDKYNIPIVGIDLAGAEAGNPAEVHYNAFKYAHSHFLKKTVHAGEAYGPESIFQAITELHADRIGHGYLLFDKNAIKDPEITDKDDYINKLSEYIADRRITIEVCLSSNQQTNPDLHDIKKHSLKDMLKRKLSVTLCTDNRLVSRTSVTDEIMKALKNFNINERMLKDIIIYGFKRSFFPGNYTEKRQYARKVISYLEKIIQESSRIDDTQ